VTPADIKANLDSVRLRISAACRRAGRPEKDVKLIAVTKTVPSEIIDVIAKLGVKDFGENRVQEAEGKFHSLAYPSTDVTWHMIGHLQSNKVKLALDLFDVIQSVDSIELADLINRRAQKKTPVFLEVNVSGEVSKSGFLLSQITPALKVIRLLPNLDIRGLMTIAPPVADPEEVRPVFRKLRELRDSFKLEHLSMGMTDDFEVAIEEGATLVRIGRALFGER
jgi:PLP dependent protein